MGTKPPREGPASPASPGALCQARAGFIWWEWVSPGWGGVCGLWEAPTCGRSSELGSIELGPALYGLDP